MTEPLTESELHEYAVKVDTEIVRLYGVAFNLNHEVSIAEYGVRHALGTRIASRTNGRGRETTYHFNPHTDFAVPFSVKETVLRYEVGAYAREPEWFIQRLEESLAHHAEAENKFNNAVEELRIEERKYTGWSRFFLVAGGHLHSSMNCSTCNNGFNPTEFYWYPTLAGLNEAEAVEAVGSVLCTVCFPSAPVEWTEGDMRVHVSKVVTTEAKGYELVQGADFSGVDFAGANLSGAKVQKGNFERSNLAVAKMTYLKGTNAKFNSADLSFADLSYAALSNARFVAADLTNAKAVSANFSNANFKGAFLNGLVTTDEAWLANDSRQKEFSTFFGANCTEASFVGADLRGARLAGGKFTNSDFTNADLSGQHFYSSDILTGSNWSGANVEGIDLSMNQLDGVLNLDSVVGEPKKHEYGESGYALPKGYSWAQGKGIYKVGA